MKDSKETEEHKNTTGVMHGRGTGSGRGGRGGGRFTSLINTRKVGRNDGRNANYNVITGKLITKKSKDNHGEQNTNEVHVKSGVHEDNSYQKLTPLVSKKVNETRQSKNPTKRKSTYIKLRSRKHESDIKHDNEPQIITPETEGWYSIETLQDTIVILKKNIATPTTNGIDQNQTLEYIRTYEERHKELVELQLLEDRNDDEQSLGDYENIEIPIWEDVVHINNEIKKYELQAQRQRHKPKDEVVPLHTYILTLRERLSDLMKEETLHNLEHPELCPQPDYQMIKEASNIAFYNHNEWDDLSFVNSTILNLKVEQTKESDEKQQKDIAVIEETYKKRKRELITSMILHDERLIKDGKVTFNSETGEVTIPDDTEMMESNTASINIPPGPAKENMISQDEINPNTQDEDAAMNEILNDDETNYSNDTKSLAESARAINTYNNKYTTVSENTQNAILPASSLRQSSKTKQESNIKVDRNNEGRTMPSYSQAISGNITSTNKTPNDSIEKENRRCIRIRFQFKATNIPVGKTFAEQIKQKLHDIMICSKEIDPTNELLAWKENSCAVPLHGKEILLIGNDMIKEYVAAPKKLECLTRDKMYYHFGLRIRTIKPVKSFTEQWNNNKYNMTSKYPILQWVAMRPSEMQISSTAYAVGYFIGSSERGEYQTLNNEIKLLHTNTKVEASYQTINQDKVSSVLWDRANRRVESEGTSPTSKQARMIKYKFSPTALVVYVDKREHVKDVRRALFDKYGMLEDNNMWPTMPDGSKMLFAPILRGSLTDETINDLIDSMDLQIAMKADEVLMDIKIKNIHEQQNYFNGHSLEYLIHQATIKIDETTDIPIFKRICRKWMIDTSNVQYQVAVQGQMIEVAGKYIEGLQIKLTKEYGPNADNHFREEKIYQKKGLGEDRNEAYTGKRNNEEEDPEMEQRINNNKGGGNYGKVMLTGMHLLQIKETSNNEPQPKAMLIHTKSDESMSGVTTTSKSTQSSIKWSDDVIENERTSEVVHENTRGKIMNSCAKYDLKYHELQQWIKEHVNEPNDPIHQWTYRQMQENIPYDKWKTIIVDIKNTRKYNFKNNNDKNDEYNDPEFDKAISSVPSEELLPPSKSSGTLHCSIPQASPLSTKKSSHNTSSQESKDGNVEDGRQ